MFDPEVVEKYIDNVANYNRLCPYCGDSHTDEARANLDLSDGLSRVFCDACGRSWFNHYKLQDREDTQIIFDLVNILEPIDLGRE